jgi:phospholipid/cholesterol/gamma-HCH transport system permease protein
MFNGLLRLVGEAGELGIFGARTTRELFRRPFEIAELTRQIYELGLKSTPLIATAGLALGAVMALHSQASMSRFGSQALVPEAVSIGIFRVLGPLVTGLLISGRVGAGIGAQLGGMRVTQQIDALEALAVDSFKYLVVTRVLACIIALPILTLVMDFAGLTGGMLLDVAMAQISPMLFLKDAFNALTLSDYLPTVLKTTVFGLIIGTVSCYLGYNTSGGAAGVGRASTRSVVFCSLLLILIDIILVKLSFFWGTP